MLKIKLLLNVLLITFIICCCFLYKMVLRIALPNYETMYLNVPADNPTQRFSVQAVKQLIRHKARHYIKLDTDPVTNMKKLEVLRYEIRKGKYLDEENIAFIVLLRPDIHYRELLQVIRICMQEKIKRYSLLKDEFVIIPADPLPDPPVGKKVELIYL